MSQRLIWIGLLLMSGGLGCQAPSYQLPAGYSSTYARHLNAEHLAAPLPEDIPPGGPIPEDSGVFHRQNDAPPTPREFQQAVQRPANVPERSRRN